VKKLLIGSLLPILAISVITIGFLPIVPSDAKSTEYEIPTWVKGIAGFWVEDRISDQDFGDGLSFLINEDIIKVPLLQSLENQVTDLENEVELLESEIKELEELTLKLIGVPVANPITPPTR